VIGLLCSDWSDGPVCCDWSTLLWLVRRSSLLWLVYSALIGQVAQSVVVGLHFLYLHLQTISIQNWKSYNVVIILTTCFWLN